MAQKPPGSPRPNASADKEAAAEHLRVAMAMSAISHTVGGRVPDRQGYLHKVGAINKAWRRRWFVLRDRTLWYYKEQKSPKPKGVIFLSITGKASKTAEYSKKRANVFALTTTGRTYFLAAETQGEMDEWLSAINTDVRRASRMDVVVAHRRATLAGTAKTSADNNAVVKHTAELHALEAQRPAWIRDSEEVFTRKIVSSLSDIPDQIFISIFSRCDRVTLQSMAMTCKRFLTLCNDVKLFEPAALLREQAKLASPYAAASGSRANMVVARNLIPWLRAEGQALEFFNVFHSSLPSAPPADDVAAPHDRIRFVMDQTLQRISFKAEGLQTHVIQNITDFFWNVGAPENELQRLNDLGADIQPALLGYWIDASDRGGLDGGWYFPVEIPIAKAVLIADGSTSTSDLLYFCGVHGITHSYSIGRDMGAEPPRQAELRLSLPGTPDKQLATIVAALDTFGFPPLPYTLLTALKCASTPLALGISIGSDDSFCRATVIVANPTSEAVIRAAKHARVFRTAQFPAFQAADDVLAPQLVALEFSFLKTPWGFNVYDDDKYCAHMHYLL